MEKQRIEYIDLAKGICILMVVFMHIGLFFRDTYVCIMVSSFLLPLYFFLSALFFSEYTGFVNFTLRKINKLLVPFFFFMFLTVLLHFTRWIITGRYDNIMQYPSNFAMSLQADDVYNNTPLWFFISLFWTSLMFYIIFIFCDKLANERTRYIVMGILCFTIGIAGYELGIHKINLPLWIDTSMFSMPFFYTGYFLKRNTYILAPNKFDKYIPFFLIILGLIVYFLADNKEMMMMNEGYGNYISSYVSAISGILFVLLLSKLIKEMPVISFLGKNSGIVLGIHWLLMWILGKALSFIINITNTRIQAAVLFALVVISLFPTIKFLLKFFPRLVGQEDLIKVS